MNIPDEHPCCGEVRINSLLGRYQAKPCGLGRRFQNADVRYSRKSGLIYFSSGNYGVRKSNRLHPLYLTIGSVR